MIYTTSKVIKENKELGNLTITQVEALSGSEYNNFWEALSQGILKNEREYIRPCPSTESSSGSANIGDGGISGSHEQTNPSGRNEITCPYGDTNCTVIDCD